MKTTIITKSDINRKYYLLDAKGRILGRFASKVALLLAGKRKRNYTPYVDNGDFVIVVNADKIALTGNKREEKLYVRYSGYPGGLKTTNPVRLLKTKPTEVIHHAVKGMLPKNRLGSRMITRLKLYAGPDHPHSAQKPITVSL